MKKSKLIVFEGPDRVGKETQSQLLVTSLTKVGARTVRVEPSKESLSCGCKLIYSMLESGAVKRYPNTFQFIQFLNRVYFQVFKLPDLMSNYDVVILDRWNLSSIAYGDATGVNPMFNRVLYWLLKKPDVTVVLCGSSFKCKETNDVYEKDIDLQRAVRRSYYSWVQEHPLNHELIDNQGTKDEVHERILDAIEVA